MRTLLRGSLYSLEFYICIALKKSGKTNRLNMWDYEVDGHAISLMANKGPMFENGNVFAWYGVKSKIVGDMNFESTPSDLYNSRKLVLYVIRC